MTDLTVDPAVILEERRRRTRRYLAVAAFCYLTAQGVATTSTLLWSPHRAEVAAVFEGTSPLLIATNGMFVSVILGYFGVSLTEKITGS